MVSAGSGERMLNVGGIELCVQTFGDPADPAILLIGGQSASMDWWEDEFCRRLATRRHIIRYDHRDTGRSTSCPVGQPAYTFADLVADAVGVLDTLGISTAHIVGISMGGVIAQCLAVDHRDRVDTLTLIATSDGLPGSGEDLPDPEPELAAYFEHAAERPDPDWSDHAAIVAMLVEDQRALMRGGFDESRVRAIAERTVQRSSALPAMTNHTMLEGGPEPGGALADITMPTLVIHGDADPLFPLAHGEALARGIPGAELLVLAGVGHEPPPPATWEVVLPALSRHTSEGQEAEEELILRRARVDPIGWFEQLYAAGASGEAELPWARTQPNPLLAEWATARGLAGPGRAVVVGCGLGADAEYVAELGFDTVGFDISDTAVRVCRERWPGTRVDYRIADLLDLPAVWERAFDLVVEVITVQALPTDLRERAIAGVRSLVAPGGTAVVLALRAEEDVAGDGPPYPLTRGDVEAFATDGLGIVSIEKRTQPPRAGSTSTAVSGGPRWLAEFRRG